MYVAVSHCSRLARLATLASKVAAAREAERECLQALAEKTSVDRGAEAWRHAREVEDALARTVWGQRLVVWAQQLVQLRS